MKVVLLNTSEKVGGAAIAANRLMKTLNKSGIDSKMLVRDRQTDDSNIISINTSFLSIKINKIRFFWERFIIFIATGFDRKNLFRASISNTGTDISKHPLIQNADIIHLHWINQGFLSLKDIKKLTKLNKPIIWTMHDMWPCTGIYHHTKDSPFYTDTIGKRVLTKRAIRKKGDLYKSGQISFVCCSHWLENEARKSALTNPYTITCIPNPIDTTIFKRLKQNTRTEFGLPEDKHLILFGALNVTDKQKGIDYLIESLTYLKNNLPAIHSNIELVVFGQVKTEIQSLFNVPIHAMGYLNDIDQIVNLYNAVDIFITSSLEENLPNTIMESMACGTPCIGFNIGGIPEMIDHKQNGYVAEYLNAKDLAKGIEWVLGNPDKLSISDACIKKVESNYKESIVSNQYEDLYNTTIKTIQ
jgi:Glycosyltransferase